MPPEIRKAAEEFVRSHVEQFDKKVPAREVKAAIRKVADALEEVRVAREQADQKAMNLK